MLTRPGVDPARHVSPQELCRCAPCDVARLAWLPTLSDRQRRALAALHSAIPRHPHDLRTRNGVIWRTLTSLFEGGPKRRPALARLLELRRAPLDAPYYTFVVLTRHGSDLLHAQRRTD